jgi:hypothetical protein
MSEAPRRRVICELKIGADSLDELIIALEGIARRISMDDLSTSGFSAGYHSSYNYRLDEDESITEESWRAALEEWRHRKREAV